EMVEIPENDPYELALRFRNINASPFLNNNIGSNYSPGTERDFNVLNVDNNKYHVTKAQLVFQTDHLNFWIEQGVEFNKNSVSRIAEAFEKQIYPVTRDFFGSEWSPGIDNDIRLTILYAKNLGYVGGYFSAADSLSSKIEQYSNEAEMFYLSADYVNLDDPETYGIIAHEFQHMIHWNVDRNEMAWVNEGLSELAVDINGYDVGGFGFLFSMNPDLQLNFWPGNEQGDSSPHYGSSYSFMRYLYDRFGSDFLRSLIAQKENGLKSIQKVLSASGIENITPEEIFQEWSIANILHDQNSLGGIYAYKEEFSPPPFYLTEVISCGSGWQERTVNQFGTDYIGLECETPGHLRIRGEEYVRIVPADPHSGDFYFWSNKGDESDMKLYRSFDLSEIDKNIELSFWTWFDIESDYDYVYVTASRNGLDWDILRTDSCTTENPTGANFGCGYNGKSSGWIQEKVDLSRYAGSEVIIQFEYITDAAVNGEGFLVDDIRIDAINYFEDFEGDEGGWDGEGFVRINNLLPQEYAVSIINQMDKSVVFKEILSAQPSKPDILDTYLQNEDFLLVINGVTRHTNQPAKYSVRFTPMED
ncbi:MAG TPA: hypothetical protein ENL10_05430, partial [Candidatus Cloacimonetes bacterium]|nr:hypothetical protein [Candidatus Cloacimonadota bacterium]